MHLSKLIWVKCLNGNSNHYNSEELLEWQRQMGTLMLWETCIKKKFTGRKIHINSALIAQENSMTLQHRDISPSVLKRQRKMQLETLSLKSPLVKHRIRIDPAMEERFNLKHSIMDSETTLCTLQQEQLSQVQEDSWKRVTNTDKVN